MNVGWNTSPYQSNMKNSYICVEACCIWFFSSFSKLYKFCNCTNYSNISSHMEKTWCWMKCSTGLLRPKFVKSIVHNFSLYSLIREKQVALSFGLKKNIPYSTNKTLIYSKFEHFCQNLLNNIKDLPEANLSSIKTKMRYTCQK